MQRPPSPSLSPSTHYSRSSTPPTEESHDLSSPTFALPEETEESIRRRQQSDFASAEIGNRLLKGWAMLADECPRSTCYGIPLVRPPKSGRDKDPPKVCQSQGDSAGKLTSEPLECPHRNVLYVALSTLQTQKERRKGRIPRHLVRYPGQGGKSSPRLACQ
jgi:hypothetical protein